MHPMLNIAIRAARAAGNHIIKSIENNDKIEWSTNHSAGSATKLDIEAEQLIIHTIQTSYPDHCIVSEHAGNIDGSDTDVQWFIDPICGTHNLAKDFPHFAISIAMRMRGKTEIACVYDPIRNELFTARRGSGAQLNNTRLRLSAIKELAHGFIGVGALPSGLHKQGFASAVHGIMLEAADVRRTGCTALDLCYLAANRIDGLLDIQIPTTTLMAGELIAKEAGVIMTDFAGGTQYLKSGNIVASSSRGVKGIVKHLREHLSLELLS